MLTGRAPERLSATPARAAGSNTVPAPDTAGTTRTIGVSVAESDWRRKIADLPAPWKAVVPRAMAPRPDRRYATAD